MDNKISSITTRVISGLHCEVHGSTGDWIVLIQGLGGHASFWAGQISALSKSRRILVYDHAGIGRSVDAGERRSISEMSADLTTVLDTLGVERADIVGHSMGGLIAQDFAISHSQRVHSLTIGGSFATASNYLRLLLEFRRDVLKTLGPAAYCRFQSLSTVPPERFETQLDWVIDKEARSLAATSNVQTVIGRIDAILAFDRRNDLASLEMPVMILAAEDDSFVPWQNSQELAGYFREAEFKLLKGGGHFFPQFAIDEYVGILREFLSSHPAMLK